jgi:Zn finger protein HypA/HybF involved in hydrogenase expression
MHDLHAADKILKEVLDFARKNKLTKITKIKIGLGRILEHGEEIKPKNLKFNIKLLSKGTLVKGAKVEIKEVAGPYLKLMEIEGR